MKRFHVTTFGCQMNEHDSERMRGMLTALGYAEAPAREDADLILFNTCSIREAADSRFVAPPPARGVAEAQARPTCSSGSAAAGRSRSRRTCSAQFPYVDVAFGPGQVHKLAEFLTSDSLTAQGYFEFEGFTGHLPARRARDPRAGCRSPPAATWRARTASCPPRAGARSTAPLDELVAEVARPRRRGRRRGHAARPERQRLRARVVGPPPRAHLVRRAAARARRHRRASSASATRARTRRT